MPRTSAEDQQQRSAALSGVMRPVNSVVERFIPSALVFAIVLTFVVAILALLLTDSGPVDITRGWGAGLSGLLAFMTQMALILLLGHTLANTGPVRALLARLGGIPKTALQGYLFVFGVAAVASLITWGLGLVVGVLLAVEVARQGKEKGLALHFPMLVAAGYSGYVIWHMGYSGSGTLTAATEGSFIAEQLGETIPISETTFAWWNLVAIVATIVAVGVGLALVAPRGGDEVVEMKTDARYEDEVVIDEVVTPADRVDASRVLTLLVGLALVAYLVIHYADGGTATLDIVNWTFLALIFLLVRSPLELIALTKNAASNVGEILLQFPLYAGIMGIMATSGLITVFSDWIVQTAGPSTFGVLAFLSAGVVNFFVPSGGGQFAVQGPVMLDAGARLGVDPSVTIMAIAYGDQWTNMIQPFWALPVLAISGLKIRDILGYTMVTLLASGLVFATTMLLVGAG
ncbi:short-chain fatty acids transporter [Nocardioides flavus (ex Wang et al. 2016)]|uniref:Short-chain fatty acids transporter n=1 Tax=Nocardioides flavus (ex Wang et al. 2016) TaxID=2058780 RepID=A0ABQ3HFI6_9ACTN|nr:TIGR00366 family protein [Nocardioides flavus (ex Wang et al. 2016)]GHE15526.1 short-chain fatty acids transporter [Nocardioides flavus (ex Wang et al. 2016)]